MISLAEPFTRKITVHPAWDRRNPDPSKNYGVHGVDITFTVARGGEGIEWRLYTGWMLADILDSKPTAAGCCYHLHTPLYEGQDHATDECHITGGRCYSDGTFITDDLFHLLRTGGDTAVFEELERRFISCQGDLP